MSEDHQVDSEEIKQVEKIEDKEDVMGECKTPSSIECRIPTTRSCPPTPRKRLCSKRKLHNLDFFETTHAEEVESFFRSFYEPKRRRSKSVALQLQQVPTTSESTVCSYIYKNSTVSIVSSNGCSGVIPWINEV